MQDLCLLFTNEAKSLSILYTNLQPNYQNISIIGKMYKRPLGPITDDYVSEPYPNPNYGVNIRLMDEEDIGPLKPFIVQPKNPIRVWA